MHTTHMRLFKAVIGDPDDATVLRGVAELRRSLGIPRAEFAAVAGRAPLGLERSRPAEFPEYQAYAVSRIARPVLNNVGRVKCSDTHQESSDYRDWWFVVR